jgi:hypothetical protein
VLSVKTARPVLINIGTDLFLMTTLDDVARSVGRDEAGLTSYAGMTAGEHRASQDKKIRPHFVGEESLDRYGYG